MKSPTFGGDAGESPCVKVQCMDALVEAVDVGLPQQPVPPKQRKRWLGQEKEKIGEPLLLWPERGDQSHGKIGSLSDSAHHPSDKRKGWKSVNVQVVPRMAKHILEDRLGIRDEGAVQGQFRAEARREQVERREAPNAKKCSRHLQVERPLCPYNFLPMAEEICQDIKTLRPPEKATGQRAEGAGHRPALLVDVSHNRRVVTHCSHPTTGDYLSK